MPEPSDRPNIVVVLVDDMGYSDIGCFGSEISTPNLDRLAGGGVRFSQMYNCARCCPTRASLLTGLYQHQAGVGLMVGNDGFREYQGSLRDDCVTVAEALRADGYRTYMSGKWHVGGHYQANRPETWTPGEPGFPTPRQRGFDRFYGMLAGGGSYFKPPYMMRDDTLIDAWTEYDDYYLTDAISEEAAKMVDDAAERPEPFFMYVAYTAPHWPLHALEEDIALYEGRYRDGWDAVRTARHEELKGMGVLDRNWDISPRHPDSHDWTDEAEKDWRDRCMAVYAAQVHRMDRGVGRIVERLESAGMLDDTLILFLADNGGCAEFLAEETSRPEPFRYDIPTRDGKPMRIGNTPEIMPGPDDTFQSYCLPWANASNAPFRFFKHWVHEGGISTPLIVHWPGRTGDRDIVHAPCHVVDVMATCLDAAGAPYPTEHDGVAVQPLEGESLLPAVSGRMWTRERPLFFEHHGNCAVRDGQWKLVRQHGGDWELYDMLADRTETTDLSGGESARVGELERMYGAWAERCGVRPWPLRT